MSSNIRIERICKNCGKPFTAKTTVTKACSDRCAKQLYKKNKIAEKILNSEKETRQIKTTVFPDLKDKEFLSVRDVSKLIGCSRQTVYNLVNTGKIKGVNIKVKKTIIPRSEIDNLFR